MATTKAMYSKQRVHMNQGQGETSYARNSSIQSAEQNRMKPLIEAPIVDLCSNTNTSSPGKMAIADMGCSSGPNALALLSIAVEATLNHFLQLQQPLPEVCVLLNDLPDNDFNLVVKSLVALQQTDEPVCVTGIVAGSFYERLFPSGSVHILCSSNSLPWLSKAMSGVKDSRWLLKLTHDSLGMISHLFLKLRAKELVPEGWMVVSFAGRRSGELAIEISHVWGTAAQILGVMASEGVIDKTKFDSFYVLAYGPSAKELRVITEEEGSFSIAEMRVHDPTNGPTSGMDSTLLTLNRRANTLRAVFEPMIVQHFGSAGETMDEFVRTAEKHLNLQHSSQVTSTESPLVMLDVSLAKA